MLSIPADFLVPAAISYAINTQNADAVAAKMVIEAANAASTPEAEAMLAARRVPTIPDFVVNAGGAAWTWWLLQGQVGADAAHSFQRLRHAMRTKVSRMLGEWASSGVSPRQTAWEMAGANQQALVEMPALTVP